MDPPSVLPSAKEGATCYDTSAEALLDSNISSIGCRGSGSLGLPFSASPLSTASSSSVNHQRHGSAVSRAAAEEEDAAGALDRTPTLSQIDREMGAGMSDEIWDQCDSLAQEHCSK